MFRCTPVLVLGCDPGLKGAVALLEFSLAEPRPRLLQVRDMPTRIRGSGPKLDVDPDGVARLCEEFEHDLAVVEAVGPAPGQQGMFGFGRSLGVLEGALAASSASPVVMVAPSVWKGALRLPGGPAFKREAVAMARKLWPATKIQNDGQAEAALIGAYWIVACGLTYARSERACTKYKVDC